MAIKQNPEKRPFEQVEQPRSSEFSKSEIEFSNEKSADEQINESVKVKQSKPLANSANFDAKSAFVRKVEGVMEEDMEEVYQSLSDADKLIFKKKGEETATYISQLLQSTKVKIQEIFNALINWLKYLPGISKAFILQEAKIKTDQLLKLIKK